MKNILTLIFVITIGIFIAGCTSSSLTTAKRPPISVYTSPVSLSFNPVYPTQPLWRGPENNLFIYPNSPAVAYGQVALLGLNLNNSGNRITVKPGENIPAVAAYLYYCPVCDPGSINQIIVGIAGQGAQACLYNGGIKSQGIAHFNLKAPLKSGTYDIRFRYAQAYSCKDAVKYWWNVDHTPTAQASIGHIIVE